ncbi:MAG: hypothetical protein ACREJX_12655, partial [Polyangiaceae bacterium]
MRPKTGTMPPPLDQTGEMPAPSRPGPYVQHAPQQSPQHSVVPQPSRIPQQPSSSPQLPPVAPAHQAPHPGTTTHA